MALINGTSNSDTIEGLQESDSIAALPGNDIVSGFAGNDSIHGNQGADTLNGGQGDDTIYGGRGLDVLHGGQGNDLMFGGVGNDTLWGDRGADTLSGSEDSDLFVLSSNGADTITDFSSGDEIGLADGLTAQDLSIVETSNNGAVNTIIQDRLTGQILATLNGVSSAAIDTSRFRSISSSSLAISPGTQATRNFDIRFDYRYDTNGFFSDPKRRAVLEAAANTWEDIIKDEFPDIPVGTSTPFVNNPQTDVSDTFVTDTPIDDLLVFVGSREFTGNTLAQGGPSGFFTNESRYTGSNFEPWIGSVGFDANSNWFFDQTLNTADDIPGDAFDFYSVALHELAHVLGFGTAKAFDNLISGSNFNGDRAKAANGGDPIPLEPAPDLGHIEVGYRINGVEPLMLAASEAGVRNFATPVDIAALADIGYIL
jgi:RTX calcium-binding nonapeptide repeat (4 copies)